MLYIKNKAIQQIKIEDIALSNTTCFESNTLKHYLFDRTAIIQIQYCLFIGQKSNMNLPESDSISKSTAIAFGHCGVPAVGDNTVASRLLAAGISTLWISTNVTKYADSDCSGTIVGTLLLFTFTKNASTAVNYDIDISAYFHSLGRCHFELHDIRVTGLFLQKRAPMDRH